MPQQAAGSQAEGGRENHPAGQAGNPIEYNTTAKKPNTAGASKKAVVAPPKSSKVSLAI
jgi:hypothetical protein